VKRPLPSAGDYRFLAALPPNERQVVTDLIRLLDARFVEPNGARVHVTPEAS